MDELTYYIIKNLVHKVLNNIDNFELVTKKKVVCERDLLVFGFKDKTTDFEIYSSDFNHTIEPTFKFLVDILPRLKRQSERESKINAINDYLGLTGYYNTWRKEHEQTTRYQRYQ